MDAKYLEKKLIATKDILFSRSSKKGKLFWLGVIKESFKKSRDFEMELQDGWSLNNYIYG